MAPRVFIQRVFAIASVGSIISLVMMASVVSLQIFARIFLEKAPPWTEELSRVCFLYTIAFGIGPAIRSNKLVRIEFIDTLLGEKAKNALQLLIQCVCLLLSGIILFQSWKFVQSGNFERSPALGIQMNLLFASLLILSISMALAYCDRLFFRDKS